MEENDAECAEMPPSTTKAPKKAARRACDPCRLRRVKCSKPGESGKAAQPADWVYVALDRQWRLRQMPGHEYQVSLRGPNGFMQELRWPASPPRCMESAPRARTSKKYARIVQAKMLYGNTSDSESGQLTKMQLPLPSSSPKVQLRMLSPAFSSRDIGKRDDAALILRLLRSVPKLKL